MKKLTRNMDNKMLAGVCSGLADYLGLDPTVVRVLFALLTVFTAGIGGLIGYLACWLIIPPSRI
ncbi:MAG TPA: PspC domain-containing protein [Bacillota bacterium]|nr:PspC domain-containing protein [Bacillota bacterium]HOH10237.1 PspC domain-containing protein [Bacillota bacterium]HOY88615.1 PspC domain-containing protein [Bacillota bacterium]HPI01199.1 PspC domain-containing protein [Bacillota bacterium]HPM63548.1 PspC domain-containing protein [Bacillota bacterium]